LENSNNQEDTARGKPRIQTAPDNDRTTKRTTGERSRTRTRERIAQAALKAFAKRGYFDTTVDDIIRICRVSRGTFYYYFLNKEDVFEHLARQAVNDLLEEMQSARTPGKDFGQIEAANLAYFRAWSRHRDLLRVLGQAAVIEPRFAALRRELRRPFIDRLRRYLQRELENGRVRQMDPQVVAYALAGMFDWFASNWLSRGELNIPETEIEHVARELTAIWHLAVYGEEATVTTGTQ